MDNCMPVGDAEAELREQMCKLWQETFGDERDFVMHYLRHYSREDCRTLRFDERGEVVAMMHYHPFTVGGNCAETGASEVGVARCPYDVAVRLVPTQERMEGCRGAYIYGVATAVECRGRGIASAMLAESMAKMRSRGIDFAMLIAEEPSLRRWYGGMGFELLEGVTASVTAPDGTNLAMDDSELNVPMILWL